MENTINHPPKISVIMPVYNGAKHIEQSIRSILAQTWTDWELVVVDDGSTDGSGDIARAFGDARIRVIAHQKNTGIVGARNTGIEHARGEYIAMLDADDVSYPKRLETGCRFLDTHPEYGLVGTWVRVIGEDGKPTGVSWKNRIAPERIPSTLLFHNCFAQSSVLIRKEALGTLRYKEGYAPAEDYDLWTRLTREWKSFNIPTILTDYRKHARSATASGIAALATEKVIRESLARLGVHATDDEYRLHRTNFGYEGPDAAVFIRNREQWLIRLKNENSRTGAFDAAHFDAVLAERWLATCSANAKKLKNPVVIFLRSPLAKKLPWGAHGFSILKFIVKSLSLTRPR